MISCKSVISLLTMDTLGDGKVLLYLLVYIAVSSAANSGYDYKTASSNGGLNTILKAVLVHESTGNGLHTGSISGQNDGHRITVTKQETHSVQPNVKAGYSYSGGQQMHGHYQPMSVKNIRVFHKSLGSTGHIRPQGSLTPHVQVVKMMRDYSLQQRQGTYNAIKRQFSGPADTQKNANTGQSLRYIHETALSRPSFFLPTVVPTDATKSGYNYGNVQQNNGYQYSQPSNQGYQLSTPTSSGLSAEAVNSYLPNGYQQQSVAPQMQFNQAFRNEGPRTSGYSYQRPSSIQSGAAEQIAVSHYVSSAVQASNQGYRYDKPKQAINVVSQIMEQPVKSFGYQYSNPDPDDRSPKVTQSIQINESAQSYNAGYHYDRPQKSFDYDKPSVTKSAFKGQPYLPLPPPVSSGNGYQTSKSAQRDDYNYDRPNPDERPRTNFKGLSYLPLPPASGSW